MNEDDMLDGELGEETKMPKDLAGFEEGDDSEGVGGGGDEIEDGDNEFDDEDEEEGGGEEY